MPNKNNLPTYFEELKLDSESTISVQEIISQLKQQIPSDYLEIASEEGNYCGSTNPKWKNKPLCERYGFTYQNKWIQLDIPHHLMEKLKLVKGEELTGSFYLDSQVLDRELSYGGIDLKNELEIIIVNPNKIVMKEVETQTELSGRELNQKVERLETEKGQLNDDLQTTRRQLTTANALLTNIQNLLGINDLNNLPQIPEGETLTTLLTRPTQQQLIAVQQELDKEIGWWDKWMSVNNKVYSFAETGINEVDFKENSITYIKGHDSNYVPNLHEQERIEKNVDLNNSTSKKIIKKMYEYYKNN